MGVLSLNDRALAVADQLAAHASDYGVDVHKVGHTRVIDAGVKVLGGINAGVMMSRICLADLGEVRIEPGRVGETPLPHVAVNVTFPVAACLASQYAGWQISVDKYFAMGSGPMRAAYGKEPLFDDIHMREQPNCAVGVLETGELPTEAVVKTIAEKCKVPSKFLTLVCARTASLAGGVQIVARSVETALHKLHELHFDLKRIVAGFGVAPLPPVAKKDITALGRTNDAVLYGAQVTLYVTGDDESLIDVGGQLPSNTSRDYGRPFGDTFKDANHDFYKIDPMLFSPALIAINNLDTGRVHTFGQINTQVLCDSFFG